MHSLLDQSNVYTYTRDQLINLYDQGLVQIRCVDGRSSMSPTHQLVVNCPWWEFGLYAMLLVALEELTWNDGIQVRHQWIENKVVYAHSDSHVHHDTRHQSDEFHCGCGHINLLMSKHDYTLTDHVAILRKLYPTQPDILLGDHKESAILITKKNTDGQLITLKSNNNQWEKGIENDEQVFLYDEDAIKILIHHISKDIVDRYNIGTTADELTNIRSRILDEHTTLTVTQFLKPAVSLVQAGELYHLTMQDEKPHLVRIG